MKVTALLGNHAEAQNNMLYIAGGGIDRAFVPPGATAPYTVTLGIGVQIRVPWTQTNQEHTLEIELVDADNNPVMVPVGPQQQAPVKAEMKFNMGRPPALQVGEDQGVALAMNMPGLPLPRIGDYSFVISIDGSEEERLPYKAAAQPGITVPPGFGPASIPRS